MHSFHRILLNPIHASRNTPEAPKGFCWIVGYSGVGSAGDGRGRRYTMLQVSLVSWPPSEATLAINLIAQDLIRQEPRENALLNMQRGLVTSSARASKLRNKGRDPTDSERQNFCREWIAQTSARPTLKIQRELSTSGNCGREPSAWGPKFTSFLNAYSESSVCVSHVCEAKVSIFAGPKPIKQNADHGNLCVFFSFTVC